MLRVEELLDVTRTEPSVDNVYANAPHVQTLKLPVHPNLTTGRFRIFSLLSSAWEWGWGWGSDVVAQNQLLGGPRVKPVDARFAYT
jgi:hypothetical protein